MSVIISLKSKVTVRTAPLLVNQNIKAERTPSGKERQSLEERNLEVPNLSRKKATRSDHLTCRKLRLAMVVKDQLMKIKAVRMGGKIRWFMPNQSPLREC